MKRLNIPFLKRFAWVGGFTLTFVILVAHGYYATQTAQMLRQRLQEKAVFINSFLAFTFSSALMLKDDVTLQQVISQLEQDQDILSVVVADDRGEIRYSADQAKIGEDIEDADMKSVFQSGEAIMTPYRNKAGDALEMVSPLKVQGRAKPMGVVRIDMTFKNVDAKIQRTRDSFFMYAIGVFLFGVTLCGVALRKWVARPILMLKNYIRTVGPLSAEAHLPESEDEIGQLNTALNEMILKFRSELQSQQMLQTGQTLQEADLIRQLFASLEPDTRLLLADRDNQITSDSSLAAGTLGLHLLDLMHDPAFGALVSTAFGNESQPARGQVTLEAQPHQATILRLPESFSKGIRTLILLKKEPTKETSNS